MTVEKRGNKYRVKYWIAGQRKSVTLDHEPSKKELRQLEMELEQKASTLSDRAESFGELAEEYIESRKNVLSPNTRRGYYNCLSRLSEAFKGLLINNIDQLIIQREINRLSAELSPKTVQNTHGFISAVLKMFRPELNIQTRLPQKKKVEMYCPTKEDIERILELAKNTRYYVPFCLGVMGMRRGEIAACSIDKLDGNILTINASTYIDEHQQKGIKDSTKTAESTRKLYLPDSLVNRINEQGYIYKGAESRLWATLSDMQEMLGIPHFRFHDLRVYFATYAHLMGIPDKVIQDTAGWKSDYTMKKIYRKSQEKENQEQQAQFWSNMNI